MVLNHLLYCSQLMVHDNPNSNRVYWWNPNSRPLTASLICFSAFHYVSELNVLFWLEGIYISLFQDQRTKYKTVAWQGRRAMPNTQKLREGRSGKQKFTFVFDKSLFRKQNGIQKNNKKKNRCRINFFARWSLVDKRTRRFRGWLSGMVESVSVVTPSGPLDKANPSQQAVKQSRTISGRRQ